ncbi:MAG: hypothetical protein HC781_23130 [Leptolyngbyaceae cyanobacterium CSU_1_4]|nr:hypothetical protein [Leptolyngbyaceae cyanobacterium CSU_1_4]
MRKKRPRDAKGRFVKRNKDNETPKGKKGESVNSENSESTDSPPSPGSATDETTGEPKVRSWRNTAKKPPDDSKGTALSTTRRDRPHADERNDPRYFRDRVRDSSYNAGQAVGASLRNFLDSEINGQVKYEFPDWLKALVKSETKYLRNHLKRSERLARRNLYNQILSLDLLQLAALLLAIVSVQIYVPLTTQFNLPLGQYISKDSPFNGTTDAIYSKALQVGDKVNGYEILSGFGIRTFEGVTATA